MAIIKYFKKLQSIDSLIRRKATGNQEEFALKLNMSRSMLNEYLREMKELGFPISYCKSRNSYYYARNGKLVNTLFDNEVEKEELRHYKGGLGTFFFTFDFSPKILD
ncbi:hypothetical protein [Solitalea lacus]|uniref:hypothetical protein n=1 Tax=Solitalea lacus TaxID=2911172 RepID=UPI001EDA0F75|nr:hypothetical protein [Solitalea lacus]UKJ07502.1 hypothetical protein L2B55_18530 [Solitalea lacus]UKJ07508.1 hypothetical protein L2B55_18565 [Solitalea lacus]